MTVQGECTEFSKPLPSDVEEVVAETTRLASAVGDYESYVRSLSIGTKNFTCRPDLETAQQYLIRYRKWFDAKAQQGAGKQ